jgi:hypothetical protein
MINGKVLTERLMEEKVTINAVGQQQNPCAFSRLSADLTVAFNPITTFLNLESTHRENPFIQKD